MKSNQTTIGASALASQYNNLRQDAYGGSFLLPHEQTTPDLTLKVEVGVCYVGTTKVIYAGGNSPLFTAPVANPRIDLLTMDNAGTLARVVGTEAASPSVPAYPADKLVICEVYNRVGQTTIRDVNTAGQGYIYNDVRGFLGFAYISAAAQIADGIITAVKLNQVYVQTTGDEAIAGIKTFGSIPVLPASDPTTGNQATRKAYVDTKASGKRDVATRDFAAASGNQVIAHGLGVTPSLVKITAYAGDAATLPIGATIESFGFYDGTNNKCVYVQPDANGRNTAGSDSTKSIYTAYAAGSQVATITVDATNITIAWIKSVTPTGTIHFIWEVS